MAAAEHLASPAPTFNGHEGQRDGGCMPSSGGSHAHPVPRNRLHLHHLCKASDGLHRIQAFASKTTLHTLVEFYHGYPVLVECISTLPLNGLRITRTRRSGSASAATRSWAAYLTPYTRTDKLVEHSGAFRQHLNRAS